MISPKTLKEEAKRFPISGSVDREKEVLRIAIWCANHVWEHTNSSFQHTLGNMIDEMEKELHTLEHGQ